MEVLIVIIGIIVSIVSSTKKSNQRKAALERHRAAAAARLQAAQHQAAQRQAAPQGQSAAAQPAAMMPPPPIVDVPGQVVMPTVHAHVEPDCEVHDAPGSLGTATDEGKDPCHEEELTMVRTPVVEEAPQTGGLSLDWSGESLAKAFVMQEVLTRPCDRQRLAR